MWATAIRTCVHDWEIEEAWADLPSNQCNADDEGRASPLRTMSEESEYERKPIYSLDKIPEFQSEDEEREFWAEHEFSDELWDSLPDAAEELNRIAPLPDTPRRSRAG